MDQGWSYQYGASSYPRYRYFQQRLQWILPRWQQVMETGGLPDCISHGREKMKALTRIAHDVTDTVNVNVFTDQKVKTGTEVELRVQRKDRHLKKDSLSLKSHIVDLQQSPEDCKYIPSVTIFITTSTDYSKRIQYLEAKLSHLPKETLCNVIIYLEDLNTNYKYLDLVSASLDWRKVDYSESVTIARGKQLPKQIQYILEEKVVSVLEQITDYIKVFVPKTTDDSGDSLQDAIYMKLLKGLKDPFVVKDLSPDQNGATEEKIPTDEELNTVASAVGRDWELLGPSLGISASQIDEIKKTNVGTADRVLKMLLTWRKQSPTATLNYLLQVLDNVSHVIQVSTDAIKGLKAKTEHTPHEVSNAERDKIFQDKLLEYIEKKTKCVVCDVMSKRCGISSSLINEFMNEGYFGLEAKVKATLRTAGLPQWPREKSDDGVRTCKTFSYRCAYSMNDLIKDTEDYIKDKQKKLRLVQRLQFELFYLLQTTAVAVDMVIPVIPRLPAELQNALLDIPEIYGCGTIWGELVLHHTQPLTRSTENEVKSRLMQHQYLYNFSCQLVAPCKEQAGGALIQNGTSLRAKKLTAVTEGTDYSRTGGEDLHTGKSSESSTTASNTEDNSYKYGTLGCFVKVKQIETNEASGSKTVQSEKIHAVTCAHVLNDCDTNVEVLSKTYQPLGEKRRGIYEPEALDVAIVEVYIPEKTFDVALKNLESFPLRWSFYNDNPLGMTVYKHGSVSQLTRGICASVDYQTEKTNKINNRLRHQGQAPLYNILISPLVGEGLESIKEECSPPAKEVSGDVVTGNEPRQEEELQEIVTGAQAQGEMIPKEENPTDSKENRFSEEGDSGSVVCKDDVETGNILAIALLNGHLKIPGDKTKNIPPESYSYASSMIKTVEKLQEMYSCAIRPACDK